MQEKKNTKTVPRYKAEARKMFGWIPPQHRNLNPFLMALRGKGFSTTEELKSYVHKELIPSTTAQRMQQRRRQAVENTQNVNTAGPLKSVQKKESLQNVTKKATLVQGSVKQKTSMTKQKSTSQISREAKTMLNTLNSQNTKKPSQRSGSMSQKPMGLSQSMSLQPH